MKKKVKLFQITAAADHLYGLDAEGNIWEYSITSKKWDIVSAPVLLEEEEQEDQFQFLNPLSKRR